VVSVIPDADIRSRIMPSVLMSGRSYLLYIPQLPIIIVADNIAIIVVFLIVY